MASFKFVISDPATRRSYQLEVDQSKVMALIGKKIGEEFNGDLVGLSGYGLTITGGTDRDGFPMHPSVKGSVKKRVLLTTPPGFHPLIKGERRRKTVRGNTISDSIAQINVKISKKGEKPVEELIPVKAKPKEEKKEEVKEQKQEVKKEKKEEKIEVKEQKQEVKEEKQEKKVEVEKAGGGESKKE